jgi:hypothetical protein
MVFTLLECMALGRLRDTVMSNFLLLDPCLPPSHADAIRRIAAEFGTYRMYVEAPKSEGLGQGLVRRHDAALNHLRQIMARGEMESLQDLAARTNLFRGTWADEEGCYVPGIERLFNHEGFIDAARQLIDRPLIEPSMLYANFLLPGMELATHTDTPEYRGLSKKQVPEWLLVVMAHSGLFEQWRIKIAAAVSFFAPCEGGDFVLYPEGVSGEIAHVPVRQNTAVVLDTDEIFHGVERVGRPDTAAPPAEIGMGLTWTGETWDVGFDGEAPVAKYPWGGLRFSLQWKAYGYRDDAEKQLIADHSDDLSEPMVRDMLIEDLRLREVITDTVPDDTDLALAMIDTYVQFPGWPS